MKKLQVLFAIIISGNALLARNPLTDFTQNQLLENSNISLLVADLKTGKTIYQFRPKSLVTSASTMKLVTTCTALETLGRNFRFETKLEIDGKIGKDSVLYGNLYIKGGGDPTLGSEKTDDPDFLRIWVDVIKKNGINKITGHVIADASLFDDEGINPRWTWEDMGNYYAAGAYGISYLDNTYKMTLRSGIPGTTPEILNIKPEITELVFDNKLKSTGILFDSAYFYGVPHSNQRIIRGQIPANRDKFIIKGDIPNPALLLAKHLDLRLRENGVSIINYPTDSHSTELKRTVIYTHYSPPLSQIVKEINIHSNNHYAEHLFRYLSLKTDTVASTNQAIKAINSFWKSKNLPVDQLIQYDGSGLSPMNAISAHFFVELLTYMRTKSQNTDILYNSLPVAGESGTLSSLLKNTSLHAKVRAKSGTITGVKCYAGYLKTNDKDYVFAILINNANGNSKAVVKKIEEFLLQISIENKK